MKSKILLHNARIYTQAADLVVDSMAVNKNRIVAVGKNLHHDHDFKSYHRLDLKGRTVIPGLTDAHTHFFYYALMHSRVNLQGLDTLSACLQKIRNHARTLKKDKWVVGQGYSPDRFRTRLEPDRNQLDEVTGSRPAFIFSKDEHTAWVNTRALELAGITKRTKDPVGGAIARFEDGTPSGILREKPAFMSVYQLIPLPSQRTINKCYRLALDDAYRKGITSVHSFDDTAGTFEYFSELAVNSKIGLRINYYFPADRLPQLRANKIYYGTGTEFFRVAGVKIFADGSLGSQTALCFNKYIGSKDNCGIQVNSAKDIKRMAAAAARLGLPFAIHAIGDRAVANVLDGLEDARKLDFNARHRIEHLQLIRRKDVARLQRLAVIASMQPSHCPSDIKMMRKYWGARSANAFIFRTLLDRGVPLAFGSDAPIEPLDPIGGIAAAVRRAADVSRDIFYPEQRLTAREALFGFTAGAAYAVGQEHCRGYLLPGYPADYAILSQDLCSVPATRITQTTVLVTVLDGKVKYCHSSLNL